MMEKIRMFRLSGWGIAAEYVLLAVCGAKIFIGNKMFWCIN